MEWAHVMCNGDQFGGVRIFALCMGCALPCTVTPTSRRQLLREKEHARADKIPKETQEITAQVTLCKVIDSRPRPGFLCFDTVGYGMLWKSFQPLDIIEHGDANRSIVATMLPLHSIQGQTQTPHSKAKIFARILSEQMQRLETCHKDHHVSF